MNVFVIIIIGFLIVIAFDAIGSILSKKLKFNYAVLTFGSITIYGVIGLISYQCSNTMIGIVSSAVVGLFDSIVGLIVSNKLNAYVPGLDNDTKISLSTSLFVAALAAFCGYISILIFS